MPPRGSTQQGPAGAEIWEISPKIPPLSTRGISPSPAPCSRVCGAVSTRDLCAKQLPPCLPPCCSLSQLSPAACWCLTHCPQPDAHPLGAEAERKPSSSPAAPRSRARGSVGSDITRGYFVARLCKYSSVQRLQLSSRAIPSPRLCGSRSLLPHGYFAPALHAPCAPKSQTPQRTAWHQLFRRRTRRVPSPTGSALAPAPSSHPGAAGPRGARACQGGARAAGAGGTHCYQDNWVLPPELLVAAAALQTSPSRSAGSADGCACRKWGARTPPSVLGSTPRCVEHPPSWPWRPQILSPPLGLAVSCSQGRISAAPARAEAAPAGLCLPAGN